MNLAGSEICHVIVAGGSGKRFDGELPKQFHLLDGKPVLMRTIENMRKYGRNGVIITVMSPAWREYWENTAREYGFDTGIVVDGGETRWHSVKSALASVPAGVKAVTVHDGARPLVDKELIYRLLDGLEQGNKAVIPVTPMTESIRKITGENPEKSKAVARSDYRNVQTPQAFDAEILLSSYSAGYRQEFTDDASVVEFSGHEVTMVEGTKRNIKITYPIDLKIAELYLDEKWKD